MSMVPLLGRFFGYTNPNVSKTELVVLITPYLLPEEIDRATAEAAQRIEERNEYYRNNPPDVYKELFNKQ